jgi:hypothetical protein
MISLSSSDIAGSETPENLLICKDLTNNLSREAKYVLLIVFNSPMESMNQVSEILRESHWSWKTIRKTFKEIKGFLDDLRDYGS